VATRFDFLVPGVVQALQTMCRTTHSSYSDKVLMGVFCLTGKKPRLTNSDVFRPIFSDEDVFKSRRLRTTPRTKKSVRVATA